MLLHEEASSADSATDTQSLGKKIRHYRRQHQLKLVELAEQCGISPSFLSQIERDQANPSVTTLYNLADALDVSIANFFTEMETAEPTIPQNSAQNAQVVLADQRKILIYPGSGIRNELLSPDLQRAIQLMRVVMPPGTNTGATPFVHRGEECGIVLQGQLETWVGDEVYTLGPGDAIYHDSTIPHRSRNIGDTDVIMIVAKTPPSF